MIQPYVNLQAKRTRIEDFQCEDSGLCYGDIAITFDDLAYMISDTVGRWNDLDVDQQKRLKFVVEDAFRQIACEAVFETCLACGRDDEEVCHQCRTGNLVPVINESSPLGIYLEHIFSN